VHFLLKEGGEREWNGRKRGESEMEWGGGGEERAEEMERDGKQSIFIIINLFIYFSFFNFFQ
jgi:hypothetical protein